MISRPQKSVIFRFLGSLWEAKKHQKWWLFWNMKMLNFYWFLQHIWAIGWSEKDEKTIQQKHEIYKKSNTVLNLQNLKNEALDSLTVLNFGRNSPPEGALSWHLRNKSLRADHLTRQRPRGPGELNNRRKRYQADSVLCLVGGYGTIRVVSL